MTQITACEELLRELGFRPTRTKSGNLSFKYEGLTCTLNLYKDDPTFFRATCSNIWRIETPDELREALDVSSQLTAGRKVAKLFVEPDRSFISASVELFLPDQAAMRFVASRALQVLKQTAFELIDTMRRNSEEREAAQLRALVRRRLFEVLTDGVFDGVRVLFAEDYVCSDPATPAGGWPAGPVAAVALASAYRGAFEQFRVTIHQQHVAGSVVTTRWSLTGCQTGPLLGLAPCGREVTLEAISIDELRGAQIAHTSTAYDCGQIARHLLTPTPATDTTRAGDVS